MYTIWIQAVGLLIMFTGIWLRYSKRYKKKELFRKRGLQISVIGLIISFGAYWLYFFLKI